MTENATVNQPSESQTSESSPSLDVGNAFSASNDGAESSDASQTEQSSGSEESTKADFHINNFNFNEPSNVDDAKSQIGRMKSYINDANDKIKHFEESNKSNVAPDAYEFSPNDQLKELNITLDNESEQLQDFQKIAKDMNFSQDQYNELVNYKLGEEINAQKALQEDAKAHVEHVLTEVGDGNKEEGMKKLRSITSQLSEMGVKDENLEALQDAISIDSKAIQAVQHLIKSTTYKSSGELPTRDLQSEYNAIRDSMATTEWKTNESFKLKTIAKLGKVRAEADKYGIKLER